MCQVGQRDQAVPAWRLDMMQTLCMQQDNSRQEPQLSNSVGNMLGRLCAIPYVLLRFSMHSQQAVTCCTNPVHTATNQQLLRSCTTEANRGSMLQDVCAILCVTVRRYSAPAEIQLAVVITTMHLSDGRAHPVVYLHSLHMSNAHVMLLVLTLMCCASPM
jgi:hypothetical protein